MTKNDIIRKLSSRKLWLAVALFVSGLITAFGGASPQGEAFCNNQIGVEYLLSNKVKTIISYVAALVLLLFLVFAGHLVQRHTVHLDRRSLAPSGNADKKRPFSARRLHDFYLHTI